MKQRFTVYITTSLVMMVLLFISSVVVSQNVNNSEIQFTDSKGVKLYTYKTGEEAFITLTYPAKNVNPSKKETLSALVASEIESEGEVISLTETGPATGVFKGSIKLRVSPMPFAASGFLEVGVGDKLLVKYKMPENDKGIEELIFDNAYYRGPDWTFVNTGANHIVLLAPTIVITIDGKPAEKGIFVSAFHDKVIDGKKTQINVGGTGKGVAPAGVKWEGKTTAIAVWGTQEGKDNGCAEGETFKWKIWRPSDGKVYDAVATYITNDERISHGSTYTKDGISGIIALTVKTK